MSIFMVPKTLVNYKQNSSNIFYAHQKKTYRFGMIMIKSFHFWGTIPLSTELYHLFHGQV